MIWLGFGPMLQRSGHCKFSGEVDWLEIDLGKDSVSLDHLIAPEQRRQLALGTQ